MIGWLDCAAGASGDMLLGALVDAGVPVGTLQAAVDALGVEPVELAVSAVERHGIGATAVEVRVPDAAATRTWADVRGLVEAADLPDAGILVKTSTDSGDVSQTMTEESFASYTAEHC